MSGRCKIIIVYIFYFNKHGIRTPLFGFSIESGAPSLDLAFDSSCGVHLIILSLNMDNLMAISLVTPHHIVVPETFLTSPRNGQIRREPTNPRSDAPPGEKSLNLNLTFFMSLSLNHLRAPASFQL